VNISLVIPCSNGHYRFLDVCLEYVFNSNNPPEEVIVVFDGFNKQQYEHHGVDKLKEKFNYVEIFSEKKLYCAGSRQLGVDNSKGEIISFFDADDFCHPQKFDVIRYYFSNFDVNHINHSYKKNNFKTNNLKFRYYDDMFPYINDITSAKVVHSKKLYDIYFSDGYEKCENYNYGSYGLPIVHDGHSSVRREIFDTVKFRGKKECGFELDRKLKVEHFPAAGDFEFCMEVMYNFNKSLLIDLELSGYNRF
jgi:hypothetical protein